MWSLDGERIASAFLDGPLSVWGKIPVLPWSISAGFGFESLVQVLVQETEDLEGLDERGYSAEEKAAVTRAYGHEESSVEVYAPLYLFVLIITEEIKALWELSGEAKL